MSLDGNGLSDASDASRPLEPHSREITASSIFGRNERGWQVRQAIDRLEDSADRELLHQVFFEGLSVRGVAARRGVSPDTLRYRFDVLLRKMKEILKDLE